MRRWLLIVFCIGLTDCEGGFHVRGSIMAQDQSLLSDCTATLKGPPNALSCCDNNVISPPNFNLIFTVAPSTTRYKLVLACEGFQPEAREFTCGKDVTPSKPLELGVVTFQRSIP